MRQRAMIRQALACEPALLVADEPTTALDVTIQAPDPGPDAGVAGTVGMAIQFISHNLAVVSEIATRSRDVCGADRGTGAGGRAVRRGRLHPYTQGLIATLPDGAAGGAVDGDQGGPEHGCGGAPATAPPAAPGRAKVAISPCV